LLNAFVPEIGSQLIQTVALMGASLDHVDCQVDCLAALAA
jgi:hypothetical protein